MALAEVRPPRDTPTVQTWERYWLHLPVAVLAVLGGATGLTQASSVGATLLWLLCLSSGLLNAVMFVVGVRRNREKRASQATTAG
jgi:hypothetical protein